MIDWFIKNYIEIAGALAGLVYVLLSIRQNIWLWPVGFLTSAIFILVFFNSKLYATMLLQVYYLVISVYGWYYWKYGNKTKEGEEQVVSTKFIPGKMIIVSVVCAFVLEYPIYWLLKTYTDSPYPVWDSVTTTLSIVATWMLARKYIENWIVWIVTDAIAVSLYFYMKLYTTTGLFLAYTILAIVGYFEWKKELNAKEISKK